jgi:hypothetical protein
MNTKPLIITLLFTAMLGLAVPGFTPAQAQSPSPTPTYDPFAQPPLSEHPTQLESGRYLFWRYCMPCHGDVGQGLTDEFRLQWEPEHQNCWARGCHSGRYPTDSFPVPTVVPPLVNVGVLERYSPDALFEYLRLTHPPEDPGLLTDEEYRAVVAFLYHMNDAPFPAATATPAPTLLPTPSFTPTPNRPPSNEATRPFWLWSLLIPILLLVFFIFKKKPGS